MATREELELQHARTVREEIEIFRDRAQKVLAGEISEDEFRPFRLKHGIYGQRQPGVIHRHDERSAKQSLGTQDAQARRFQ